MRWEVGVDEGGFDSGRRRWWRKRRTRRRSWILLYLLHLVCTFCKQDSGTQKFGNFNVFPPKFHFNVPFHVFILQYLTDETLL